ncbi:zinc finger domain-containing protein [Tricharina praecox]|uniref:zinc finger domain-containing protein n=1 Tax=Tricharina praecox TaxID=43433 RepID=UPI00221E7E05|nr:zinc finger domain-containing protein [Tricharina praecox]KAI5843634.1 zinc finger domain-containing protein [Tricharina praecox]
MSRATLPPPLTASAREARFAFYCTLCSKGYSRVHEYEAHENSYDHQHKKRFQEMKALQKPIARPRRASLEHGGIKPISLGDGAAGAKKKGGFRSAFGGGEVKIDGAPPAAKMEEREREHEGVVESESEDEGWERYDPERPTGV